MKHLNTKSNTTTTTPAKDGYGLGVIGLDNDQFVNIHAPALTVIFLSLLSVIAVLISSFKNQNIRTFFRWSKAERFVIYLAICDGLFNICHSMDHLHIVIVKNHIYPKELCVFYGFMLAEFMTSQHLLVNLISINAFVLVFFERQLKFGNCDWKLLTYAFGIPCIATIAAASADVLGPNGAFCYFDGVKGDTANLFFTTIPLVIIIILDIIFYTCTWWKIRKTEPKFLNNRSSTGKKVRSSNRAAKNMSLFVVAFVVQWWVLAFYGIWEQFGDVPQAVFQMLTIFVNTGGILNGIVYIILRRRKVSKLFNSFVSKVKQDNYTIKMDSIQRAASIVKKASIERQDSTVKTTNIKHQDFV